MSKSVENERILKINDDIDPVLFNLQYNESGKVIDYCKSQQWYVATLAVGINYSFIVISQQYLKIIPCIAILILLIMITATILITIFGFNVLDDLSQTAIKHRDIARKLKSVKYLKVPEDLKEMLSYPENKNERDTNFVRLFQSAILVSSIISFLILFSKFLTPFILLSR